MADDGDAAMARVVAAARIACAQGLTARMKWRDGQRGLDFEIRRSRHGAAPSLRGWPGHAQR